MPSDRKSQRSRRRALLGAGARTFGRGLMRVMPGYDSAHYWTRNGLDWFETLGNLKGAAMKMGQIASQYRDLLPPQLVAQLERLQRDSQPRPFADLQPELDAAWSKAQWQRVKRIEPQALAAASIGQVHRARLTDGTAVVVKIRYPGVADAVDADVANLGRLLKFSRMLPIDASGVDAVLTEVRARFAEETDYGVELGNLNDMRALTLPGIAMPEPIADLCSESVLVLTELPSQRVDSLRGASRATRDRIGEIVTTGVCRQVFTHGLLHADPHPGNFGITDDGELALYDYGCIKRVARSDAEAMRDIVTASLADDWMAVHEGLFRLGSVPHADPGRHADLYADIYRRHAAATLEPVTAKPLYDFAEGTVVERIRAEIRADLRHWNRFKPAPEMLFLMRTLSGLYWMLRSIEARAPIEQLLHRIAEGEFGPEDK